MGSSPKAPKQADPAVGEEKAKKKALALAQAYEAKTAALGTASTKLAGTERNTKEIKQEHQAEADRILSGSGEKSTLKGFDTYVPGSTNAKTAAGVYETTSRNERNQNAALLEYTRRKREPQSLVVT